MLQQMTIEEKIDLLGGSDGFYLRGVLRLHVPRMKMADGPLGVRGQSPATAVAGGIALAASWNPPLAGRVGVDIGPNAHPAVPVGGGSAAVQPRSAVSFRDGIGNVAGKEVKVLQRRGIVSVADQHYALELLNA